MVRGANDLVMGWAGQLCLGVVIAVAANGVLRNQLSTNNLGVKKEYLFQESCQLAGCFSIPHIFQILELEASSHKNKALRHSAK